MRRGGEPGVEPPIAPGCRDDRKREQDVDEEQGVGLRRGLGRLALIEPDRNQEQRREDQPTKRDDPAALIFEDALRTG